MSVSCAHRTLIDQIKIISLIYIQLLMVLSQVPLEVQNAERVLEEHKQKQQHQQAASVTRSSSTATIFSDVGGASNNYSDSNLNDSNSDNLSVNSRQAYGAHQQHQLQTDNPTRWQHTHHHQTSEQPPQAVLSAYELYIPVIVENLASNLYNSQKVHGKFETCSIEERRLKYNKREFKLVIILL